MREYNKQCSERKCNEMIWAVLRIEYGNIVKKAPSFELMDTEKREFEEHVEQKR